MSTRDWSFFTSSGTLCSSRALKSSSRKIRATLGNVPPAIRSSDGEATNRTLASDMLMMLWMLAAGNSVRIGTATAP